MSVREEDRQNKNCPSRGLGLAAAAIGVGVGAALYYFFSKRPENPHGEGSTSSWECEQGQTFTEDELDYTGQENLSYDDSYITLSEHSTTDTSIHASPLHENSNYNDYESSRYNSDDDIENLLCLSDDFENSLCINDNGTQSNDSFTSLIDLENISSATSETGVDSNSSESEETATLDNNTGETGDSFTDTEFNNSWEITDSSLNAMVATVENNLTNLLDHWQDRRSSRSRINGSRLTEEEEMERARALSEEEQIKFLRDQAFRERSWSLEECSICFEVILKNQEVMSLPCTHHFHTACILPWLQEQQTCPNCRKAA